MRKKLLYSSLFMLIINIASAQNVNLGGREAGTKNTTVGFKAGYFEGSIENIMPSYSSNSFFGYYSGGYNTSSDLEGYNNTFIGAESGRVGARLTKNSTFLGYRSGYSSRSTIGQNVLLGANAGYSLTTGSGNVFIGYNSGYSETGSNKLYIDNSNTATPLVYGDFDLNRVGVNALPGSFTLNVGGPINATGLYVNGSPVSLGVTAVSPWTLNGTYVNYNNGNVGIGILSNEPAYKLDVNGTINATAILVNGVAFTSSQWTTTGSVVHYMGGNVGIGTTATGSFKLAVEGKIGAREVQVTTTTPWPDYVFQPEYDLLTIGEVQKYIQENGHLPEIPSAEEVKTDGQKLGEMNVLLLKKVEEMMLYIIQQEERINLLEAQVKKLSKR